MLLPLPLWAGLDREQKKEDGRLSPDRWRDPGHISQRAWRVRGVEVLEGGFRSVFRPRPHHEGFHLALMGRLRGR